MTTASMTVHFNATFGQGPSLQLLFIDAGAAHDAFDFIQSASKAYHDRTNDRERMVVVQHLSGCASLDVSTICAVSYEDPMGDQREAVEQWNEGVSAMRGKAIRAEKEASGVPATSEAQP